MIRPMLQRLAFLLLLFFSFLISSCQSKGPLGAKLGEERKGQLDGRLKIADINSFAEIGQLKEDQAIGEFVVKNLYLDGSGRAFAVGLIHRRLKFRVFVAIFPTAMQAAFWHKTLPTSNKGEAHALEHVVLGKGQRGKELATLYVKELGEHSAATHPRFTWYHFNVQTGEKAFWQIYEKNLEMFFQPDFIDSEIEKEVYHFGVRSNSQGLDLIEKGTVYAEMNSNIGLYDNWYAMLERVFGQNHPARWDSGGTPEGLRKVTAKDIRDYHQKNYRLDQGFGSILVIPPDQGFYASVTRLSDLIQKIEGAAPSVAKPRQQTEHIPQPSTRIAPEIFEYASENPSESGSALLAWEAIKGSDFKSDFKLALFLASFAQGSQSPLGQRLIDKYTVEEDFPLKGIWLGINDDYGKEFIYGSLSGLASSSLNRKTLNSIWLWLKGEIEEVKKWPDHSAELKRLNTRVLSMAKSFLRQQKAMFDQPPGFGERSTGDGWKSSFESLDEVPGFRKPFVQSKVIEEIKVEIESGKNIWHDLIRRYRLMDQPYILGRIPSKEKTAQVYRDLELRLQKKKRELIKKYNSETDQQALQEFSKSEKPDTGAQKLDFELTSSPPLTFDDDIQWRSEKAWGVPLTVSEFAGTSKISFGLSQSLLIIRPSDYVYLPLLFDLIDSVGLYEPGGKVTTPAELDEEMAREVYTLGFGVDINPEKNLSDWTLSITATSIEDFKKSFNYWRRILFHSNLQASNLKVMRNIIGRRLSGLASARQAPPENWLPGLSGSYFHQQNLLYQYFNSPYARLHLYRRYRWWLHDVPDENENRTIDQELASIHQILENSPSLKDFVFRLGQAEWSEPGEKLVNEIKEVSFELSPHYREELKYLLAVIVEAWRTPPEDVLKKLRQLRSRLVVQHQASGFLVGSGSNIEQALQVLRSEKRIFEKRRQFKIFKYERENIIEKNLKRRIPEWSGAFPQKIAFIDQQNSNGHVVVDSEFAEIDRFKSRSFYEALAINTMAGEGGHGLFMKTWQQGLAYNNSIGLDPYYGEVSYYAEQSPNLKSTLGFVTEELLKFSKKVSVGHLEYSMAQFFSGSRLLDSPVSRGYGLFRNIRLGFEPRRIRRFREALLKVRTRSDLLQKVREAYLGAVTPVLFDRRFADLQKKKKTRFFFVAPEKQVIELERWYGEGPSSITRVYPADFWIRKF